LNEVSRAAFFGARVIEVAILVERVGDATEELAREDPGDDFRSDSGAFFGQANTLLDVSIC
jgi:hypothetical protein